MPQSLKHWKTPSLLGFDVWKVRSIFFAEAGIFENMTFSKPGLQYWGATDACIDDHACEI